MVMTMRNDELKHYGVKGMEWGKEKKEEYSPEQARTAAVSQNYRDAYNAYQNTKAKFVSGKVKKADVEAAKENARQAALEVKRRYLEIKNRNTPTFTSSDNREVPYVRENTERIQDEPMNIAGAVEDDNVAVNFVSSVGDDTAVQRILQNARPRLRGSSVRSVADMLKQSINISRRNTANGSNRTSTASDGVEVNIAGTSSRKRKSDGVEVNVAGGSGKKRSDGIDVNVAGRSGRKPRSDGVAVNVAGSKDRISTSSAAQTMSRNSGTGTQNIITTSRNNILKDAISRALENRNKRKLQQHASTYRNRQRAR